MILNNNYAFGDLKLKFLKSIKYLARLLYVIGQGKAQKCGNHRSIKCIKSTLSD